MTIGIHGRCAVWVGRTLFRVMALLAGALTGATGSWAAHSRDLETPVTVRLADRTERFDLRREGELLRLKTSLEKQLAQLEKERSGPQRSTDARVLRKMSERELRAHFSEQVGNASGKEKRGLQEMARLCLEALNAKSEIDREEKLVWIAEIACALGNNARSPTPASLDVMYFPVVFLDYARNPIARGDKPARNVPDSQNETAGCNDPPNSSFWTCPATIRSLDLFHGFGRTALPEYQSRVWNYHGPKLGYGMCAGFEASSGGRRIKVKFGETTSEPFAARIFSALGYNVEPVDHVPSLKIRYDRRLFREFHLRKDLNTRVTALWTFKVWTIRLQKRRDPFSYITAAVMKDGTLIDGRELKSRLLRQTERAWPEMDPDNFRAEVEEQIDHLVTVPANVQPEDPDSRSIGPWEFEGLGHEHRRELRGAGLLAAWLGWCDSRFENTRLKIVSTPDGRELKHFFTDVGGGLGKAIGPISRHCESPNDFAWTFTEPQRNRGRGRMTTPFRIVGYEPIDDTRAFKEMTVDDARWMARWIGQLTEKQIVEALIASGFDSAHVRLYTEKLISRRDHMIHDLDLGTEVALLRPNGTDRRFDFDPRSQGSVRAEVQGRGTVEASPGHAAIRMGVLLTVPQEATNLMAFR